MQPDEYEIIAVNPRTYGYKPGTRVDRIRLTFGSGNIIGIIVKHRNTRTCSYPYQAFPTDKAGRVIGGPVCSTLNFADRYDVLVPKLWAAYASAAADKFVDFVNQKR